MEMIKRDGCRRALGDDWRDHLALRTLSNLESYLGGYLLFGPKASAEAQPYTNEQFYRWLVAQVETTGEHRSRMNTFNWLNIGTLARLRSRTEEEAIEMYLDLSERLERETPSIEVEEPPERPRAISKEGLGAHGITVVEGFDQHLEAVLKRPAMYLGNGGDLTDLWSLFRGWRWGCRDAGRPAPDGIRLDAFQRWIDARYPFGRGQTWARTLQVLALGSPAMGFDSFREHWALFSDRHPPDVQDPSTALIIENALAHARRAQERRDEDDHNDGTH